jgi:hypothetical protein
VLWGIGGGLLGNLLRLVRVANTPREGRPILFSDPWYWIQFVVLASLGGFFALLYEKSGTHLTPVLAVNVGAAAPVIAQQFLSGASPVDPAN